VLRIVRSRVHVPYPLGVVAFWVSALDKWFGLLRGGWSRHVVEHPWVLRQLRVFVSRGARVLYVVVRRVCLVTCSFTWVML